MAIDESILKLKIIYFNDLTISRGDQNEQMQLGIRNIANERTEEEQKIAHEKRRVSMTRFHASQSQEQSVRPTDTLGRMYTVHSKNDEYFYLRLFFYVSHLPGVPRRLNLKIISHT